jgi:hypothetical protein
VTLPEEIDRSWLLSTYLSLRRADQLNYKDDTVSKLPKTGQNNILLKITSLNSRNTLKHAKKWLAGYYFNNAMFRTVALAETGLKVLYEKRTTKKAPRGNDAYPRLLGWYKENFNMNLDNIAKARQQVNMFKHDVRSPSRRKEFETMKEGIEALKELISLLKRI